MTNDQFSSGPKVKLHDAESLWCQEWFLWEVLCEVEVEIPLRRVTFALSQRS